MSKIPPPLPPRQNKNMTEILAEEPPPTYDEIMYSGSTMTGPWTSQDPRSSSMHSLVPSESNQQNERRKLLLVYIHGFMGNETSFRSFPAHVHKLLTTLLAGSHVVHTKIYPRYRSKRKITFARDDFSTWLEPHEDARTDVVLLGHSMGGLVSAEVVLKPASPPASRPLQHRILGTINFDVPFLGMHPGVIRSGLASIFTPAAEPQDKHAAGGNNGSVASPISPVGRQDTLWELDPKDPNYNPPMPNDVILPVRKGWESAWHFVSKHSGNLTQATRQLVSSHMEFGGTMANFGELKMRYTRVRALEEEADNVRKSVVGEGGTPPRVRFINYYTASTGIYKKPKPPTRGASASLEEENAHSPIASNSKGLSLQTSQQDTAPLMSNRSQNTLSPLSIMKRDQPNMEDNDDQHDYDDLEEEDWETAAETMTLQDPMPIESDDYEERKAIPSPTTAISPTSTLGPALSPSSTFSPTMSSSSTLALNTPLPPIPDLPPVPPALDVSYIEDAETRKLVEREHNRAVKAYDKAVKDREKAINDRAKLEEKRERKAKKDAEKAEKDAAKAKQKADAEEAKRIERQKNMTEDQIRKENEKAEKDALKAKQKADAEKAKQVEKQAKLEQKKAEKDMTHHEKEMLRLEKERQRMEAEARRMRGEPELTPEPEPTDEPESGSADDHERELSEKSDGSTMQSTQSALNNEWEALADDIERFESTSTRAMDAEPSSATEEKPKKPIKDRKFCVLPPKDANGQRDPCWVRVFMENVDEVGAHCGLFFVDERYERLVGDVAERIEGWVLGDIDRRMFEKESS